jgi:hypothetical protein
VRSPSSAITANLFQKNATATCLPCGLAPRLRFIPRYFHHFCEICGMGRSFYQSRRIGCVGHPSSPSAAAHLLTNTDRPLIFYSGTVPVLSLAQTTLQIACLHLSTYLPPVFFLILAATGSLAWLLQASIWASCELSGGLPAPGKIIATPQWCPQYAFRNHGGDLSAALTIFKTTLAWIMLIAYLAMAVLAFLNMRQVSEGKRVDTFYELEEIQPLTPRRTKAAQARPYSTKFKFVPSDNAPAIQVLPVPDRP